MEPKLPVLLDLGLMAIALFSVSSGWAQPLPVTSPASNMLNDRATLNGAVNPQGANTTVWFEWGSSYDDENSTPPQSVGNGFIPLTINAALTDLTQGVTYHY